MPELPEVETVRLGLEPCLKGSVLEKILLRRATLRIPLPTQLEKTLKGRRLLAIARRAKYLLLEFNGGHVLIVHLGMSGKLLLEHGEELPYLKHDHVVFFWDNGIRLVFNDARRFGLMALAKHKDIASHPLLRELGPEPLDTLWNGKLLYASLQKSCAPVKSALMDQSKLVGVGNIYACEALFRARIHPARIARDVSKKEAVKLALAIKAVLTEAIASGGSTLRDYVRSSGDSGYFQHHFAVYGRAGKACPNCGGPVKVIRQAGRSSFFCAVCQH